MVRTSLLCVFVVLEVKIYSNCSGRDRKELVNNVILNVITCSGFLDQVLECDNCQLITRGDQ